MRNTLMHVILRRRAADVLTGYSTTPRRTFRQARSASHIRRRCNDPTRGANLVRARVNYITNAGGAAAAADDDAVLHPRTPLFYFGVNGVARRKRDYGSAASTLTRPSSDG